MGSRLAEDIVFDIIDELTDRKGFDSWWYQVDQDLQQEIQGALVGIIDSNIERVNSLKNNKES